MKILEFKGHFSLINKAIYLTASENAKIQQKIKQKIQNLKIKYAPHQNKLKLRSIITIILLSAMFL